MKSHSSNLLDVAAGILADVKLAYPEYKRADLDLLRLSRNVDARGLGLFTLDLPQMDQALTAGLQSGRLVYSGPLSRAVSKKILVPRLFEGLWLRVFDVDLCLLPEPDVNAILFLRQLTCLGKKIAGMCDHKRLRKAVSEFHYVERNLPKASLRWSADDFDPHYVLPKLHFHDALVVTFLFFQSQNQAMNQEMRFSLIGVSKLPTSYQTVSVPSSPLRIHTNGTERPGAVASDTDLEQWQKRLD